MRSLTLAMGLKNTFALIGIGAYLSLFVDVDITSLAVGLALLFTAINIVGTKETAALQRILVDQVSQRCEPSARVSSRSLLYLAAAPGYHLCGTTTRERLISKKY